MLHYGMEAQQYRYSVRMYTSSEKSLHAPVITSYFIEELEIIEHRAPVTESLCVKIFAQIKSLVNSEIAAIPGLIVSCSCDTGLVDGPKTAPDELAISTSYFSLN